MIFRYDNIGVDLYEFIHKIDHFVGLSSIEILTDFLPKEDIQFEDLIAFCEEMFFICESNDDLAMESIPKFLKLNHGNGPITMEKIQSFWHKSDISFWNDLISKHLKSLFLLQCDSHKTDRIPLDDFIANYCSQLSVLPQADPGRSNERKHEQ